MYCIYQIRNLVNNKTYIGQRKCPEDRTIYNDYYMGSGKILKKAINKHGIKNFKREILEICESKQKVNEIPSISKEITIWERKYTINQICRSF